MWIKYIYSLEIWMGSLVGSFFYDFVLLCDVLKKEDFDIIYEVGYMSIIFVYIWFNVKKWKCLIFIMNMDGLENKWLKFSLMVRCFLDWEEKMVVKYSYYLIVDNMGIYDYYKEKYGKESKFLVYGVDIYDDFKVEYLEEFGLKLEEYYILIVCFELENNIVMVIEGYLYFKENGCRLLIVVGKINMFYGKEFVEKYGNERNVEFVGGIYDFKKLDLVCYFLKVYFYGYSVGGINFFLFEVMVVGCFIFVYDNIFNCVVLKENVFYYFLVDKVIEYFNCIDMIVEGSKI